MNKLLRFTLPGLLSLCLLPIALQAQMKGWEVGPWLGTSYYFGDLNTSYYLGRPNLAGGFGARYNFNNRLAFKISGNYGRVEAYDSDSNNPFEQARNLSFESNILDGTVQFEFNFLPYNHGSRDQFFTPYLFGGLTLLHYNPKAELDGVTYALRPLGTEGQFKGEEYHSTTGALAYGIGFKVDLSYEWSLNFDLGARSTFTDYLDDVSTVYPDRSDLLRMRGETALLLSDRSIALPGEELSSLGREGRQRGDSTTKDNYIFAGVSLLYYFGDIRCPSYGSRRRR